MDDFVEFPKIPRLFRPIVISEKIDGTNACVRVAETAPNWVATASCEELFDCGWVRAGSRTRWLTIDQDNFGFAAWVREHAKELAGLGPGTHYGEWWGRGIQRGYGLSDRRFSLFNTTRWGDDKVRPSCCWVVPEVLDPVQIGEELFRTNHDFVIKTAIEKLRLYGSVAAPGFMRPEGVVVFHTAANAMFKVTLERDEERKGL